jgi:hypothetical protein
MNFRILSVSVLILSSDLNSYSSGHFYYITELQLLFFFVVVVYSSITELYIMGDLVGIDYPVMINVKSESRAALWIFYT